MNIKADIDWWKVYNGKAIWTLPNKHLLVNKIKEITFKILNRYYPVINLLVKLKHNIDLKCSFCNTLAETLLMCSFF